MRVHNYLYEIAVFLIRFYSNLMLKMDVYCHASLPEGPKIFVANHPNATDHFVIHLLSSEGLSVLISVNAFAFPLFGLYIRYAGQIPVVPGQGADAIEKDRCLLEQGYSVGVFPEGQFSPQNGGFHEPRTGAARVALLTGAPCDSSWNLPAAWAKFQVHHSSHRQNNNWVLVFARPVESQWESLCGLRAIPKAWTQLNLRQRI